MAKLPPGNISTPGGAPRFVPPPSKDVNKPGEAFMSKPGQSSSNPLKPTIIPPKSSGSSGKKGGGGGGSSTRNPVSGQAEYVLPSGTRVPANQSTRSGIVAGKSEGKIISSALMSKGQSLSKDFSSGASISADTSGGFGGNTNYYKGSLGSGFIGAGKAIKEDILIAFGGKEGNYVNPIDSFEYVGTRYGEKSSGIAKIGTINPNESPFYTNRELFIKQGSTDYLLKTIELQGKKNALQSDVNLGLITPERATSTFSDYYKTNVKDSDIARYKGELKLSGNPQYDFAKFSVKAGEAGALTLATGPVGLTLGSAYVAYKGFESAVEGDTITQKALGVAGVGLGFGGFKTASLITERQILSAQLENLGTRPISFKQFDFVKGSNQGEVAFTAVQQDRNLIRNIYGKGQYITNDQGTFILPKGLYQADTKGSFSWNIYPKADQTIISSSQIGSFGAGGFSKLKDEFILSSVKSGTQPKLTGTIIAGIDNGKITNYATSVKLFGEGTRGFNINLAKPISPDALGRERFAGFGESLGKDFGITSPKSAGIITTIKQDTEGINFITGSGRKSGLGFDLIQTPATQTLPKNLFSLGEGISKSSTESINIQSTKNIFPRLNLGSGKSQQKLFEDTTTTNKFSQVSVNNLIENYDSSQIISPKTNYATNFRDITAQIPKITQPEITTTEEKQIFGKIFSPITTPNTNVPFKFDYGFGGGFALPNLSFEEGIGGRRQGKQKKRRTPSIVSAELGIYDFAPSSLEFTGIVSRPIITSRRKR